METIFSSPSGTPCPSPVAPQTQTTMDAAAPASMAIPPLPREVVINGVSHTILRLGIPLHGKTATKNVLVSRGFTVDDLTLAGLPVKDAPPDGDAFTFVWFIWLTLAEEQKPVSADMLRAIIDFSKDTNRMPIQTPDNRQLVTLHDGRTVRVPVVPEEGAGDKTHRKTAPSAKLTAKDVAERFKDAAETLPSVVDASLLSAYTSGNLAVKAALCDLVPTTTTPVALDVNTVRLRLRLDDDKENVKPKTDNRRHEDEDDDEDADTAPKPVAAHTGKRKSADTTTIDRGAKVFAAMFPLLSEDLSATQRKRLKVIASFASGEIDAV